MKVLAPLDGSDATYRALERGLSVLGPHPGLHLTLLVVMDKSVQDMPAEAREHLEFDDEDEIFVREDEARAVIQKAQSIASKHRVNQVRGQVVSGTVKETILAHAAKHDVLLMHALDGNPKAAKRRGAATEDLARAAGCSVLLVRA